MLLKNSRPYGFFLNSIKWKILAIVILTLVVGFLDDVLYKIFDFDLAIPAFFGTAIILALAFRTNKAYNRWWEAKIIWESIVNNSRSWTRLTLKLISPENDDSGSGQPELVQTLALRQLAWNYALVARLREHDVTKSVRRFLNEEDLAFISRLDNANQGLLFLQSRDLMTAYQNNRIDIYSHVELEEIIRELEASMGMAERIKKTHFPVLYDLIFEVAIYIFCGLLTYAIRDSLTIFEALFSIMIGVLLMMINEIARDMQDPFEDMPTDTPMLELSHQLERAVKQVLGHTEIPVSPKHGKYYIK